MATAGGIIAAAASTAATAVSGPEQAPADAASGSVKPSGTLEAHVKEQPQHRQHHHHQRNVSLNDWASMDATSLLSTIPSMPHKNDASVPEQGASDNSSTAGIRNETLGSAAQTHGSQEGAAVGPISSVVGSSTASGSMGDEPDVVGQGGAVVSCDAPPAAKDVPLGSPPDLVRRHADVNPLKLHHSNVSCIEAAPSLQL